MTEPEATLLNATVGAAILLVIGLVWVIDDPGDAIALAAFAFVAPTLRHYCVSRRNRHTKR